MKILVSVKRVVDYNIKVHVKPDGSAVDIEAAKKSINPFDENALEEAIRLKEQGIATEVIALTIGQSAHQDILRHSLAMGADRAVLVDTPLELQPLDVAKTLKSFVARENPDLILLGKQAIDDDAGQTGQMLAALLDYSQATFVSEIKIESGRVHVVREIDGGTEALNLPIPAVITADLRLNDPRFVKLPNLMMARKKPIETLTLDDLGVAPSAQVKQIRVAEPAPRKPGIMVGSVNELLEVINKQIGAQS